MIKSLSEYLLRNIKIDNNPASLILSYPVLRFFTMLLLMVHLRYTGFNVLWYDVNWCIVIKIYCELFDVLTNFIPVYRYLNAD